eukprot:SAG11_NODE_986_length_6284_cov_72.758771_12_plen_71_part_00
MVFVCRCLLALSLEGKRTCLTVGLSMFIRDLLVQRIQLQCIIKYLDGASEMVCITLSVALLLQLLCTRLF